jgi:putative CRISPR-associated protein (TIGR02619 family)
MRGKKKLVLSPCGTSLLTNRTSADKRKLIFKNANRANKDEVEESERKELEDLIQDCRTTFLKLPPSEAAKLSAELNGIFQLYDGNLSNAAEDIHILLATDTWLGKETASIVAEWLQNHGISNVQTWDNIGGLRTDNLENFHCAISELVRQLHQTIPSYKENGYHVVFNLTGGFKSIQGILQTLSQFYADEAVYIFETSKELLRIPKIPVVLDVIDEIRKNLKTWRRLALNLPVNPEEARKIASIFLLKIDDEFTLSPWGELVWQQIKRKIYEEQFWPPPSSRIEWNEKFEKEVNQLSPDRIYEINKRMDELAIHLEKEDHPNLRSLHCHPVQGKPVRGASHEIYAWSDKDARRIFGICEGHTHFKIICLEKHL